MINKIFFWKVYQSSIAIMFYVLTYLILCSHFRRIFWSILQVSIFLNKVTRVFGWGGESENAETEYSFFIPWHFISSTGIHTNGASNLIYYLVINMYTLFADPYPQTNLHEPSQRWYYTIHVHKRLKIHYWSKTGEFRASRFISFLFILLSQLSEDTLI